MKTVNVKGIEYEVPDRINFISVDEDGCISGFEKKPEIQDFEEDNIWCDGEDSYIDVGVESHLTGDWKDSLQDITHES